MNEVNVDSGAPSSTFLIRTADKKEAETVTKLLKQSALSIEQTFDLVTVTVAGNSIKARKSIVKTLKSAGLDLDENIQEKKMTRAAQILSSMSVFEV